jgi:CDP-diacylglycerol---serine O-phosphatidyltransferase
MKQIPNIVTLLNLVFGFIAIILILQPGETIVTTSDEGNFIAQLPERIWWGAVCIGIAAIIDFFDGFVARLMKASSPIGAQLDSLADVVSFGVAPGLILYQLLRISYIQEESGLDTSWIAFLPVVLFPMAGAYRLARFNVDTEQSYGFKGVPIPAAGLVVASLPLILWFDNYGFTQILTNKWVLYAITIILSWLMVSRLPMLALKFSNYSFKDNAARYILVMIAVAAAFAGWIAVPVVFILYVILSIITAKKVEITPKNTL